MQKVWFYNERTNHYLHCTVNRMQSTNSLDFPALIRPRLKGGRIHRVLIDELGIAAATIDGFYGNIESKPILRIPLEALIEVKYLRRKIRGDRCHVRYSDPEQGEQQLTFVAVNPDASVNYPITALAAQVLEAIRSGEANTEPIRFTYAMAPLRPIVKLLIVPIAFAVVIICPSLVRFGGVPYSFVLGFVGFAICAGLAATAIDYARIHTAWHPLVKVLASVISFMGAFCLFAILVALLDFFATR
jgi:hypothetical protein